MFEVQLSIYVSNANNNYQTEADTYTDNIPITYIQ